MEGDPAEDWVTLPEAAELIHVDPTTVRRWVKQGLLTRRRADGVRETKRRYVRLWALDKADERELRHADSEP